MQNALQWKGNIDFVFGHPESKDVQRIIPFWLLFVTHQNRVSLNLKNHKQTPNDPMTYGGYTSTP